MNQWITQFHKRRRSIINILTSNVYYAHILNFLIAIISVFDLHRSFVQYTRIFSHATTFYSLTFNYGRTTWHSERYATTPRRSLRWWYTGRRKNHRWTMERKKI